MSNVQKAELTENQQRWMKNVEKFTGTTFSQAVADFEKEMEVVRRENNQYKKNSR